MTVICHILPDASFSETFLTLSNLQKRRSQKCCANAEEYHLFNPDHLMRKPIKFHRLSLLLQRKSSKLQLNLSDSIFFVFENFPICTLELYKCVRSNE